jgi:hypothetical protein
MKNREKGRFSKKTPLLTKQIAKRKEAIAYRKFLTSTNFSPIKAIYNAR